MQRTTTPNTEGRRAATSSAERSAEWRQRAHQAGWVGVSVWVPPDLAEKIFALIGRERPDLPRASKGRLRQTKKRRLQFTELTTKSPPMAEQETAPAEPPTPAQPSRPRRFNLSQNLIDTEPTS
ncbi:hypothetical protein [Roseomonas harenae]|uniref:hypothetical protein n=1 Tax=Muricoccus harenae TaxID=2692566 RepID=UPI00133188E8|nr:hypothetical protein [Roseomonas harenae]